jgi:hypothetical protein
MAPWKLDYKLMAALTAAILLPAIMFRVQPASLDTSSSHFNELVKRQVEAEVSSLFLRQIISFDALGIYMKNIA